MRSTTAPILLAALAAASGSMALENKVTPMVSRSPARVVDPKLRKLRNLSTPNKNRFTGIAAAKRAAKKRRNQLKAKR